MSLEEYWNWIKGYKILLTEDLLQYQVDLPAGKADPRQLAQLRISERMFNMYLNRFSNLLYDLGTTPGQWLEKSHGAEESRAWKKLFVSRDTIADTLSHLIESDPASQERYEQYCENLKQHRTLGAML